MLRIFVDRNNIEGALKQYKSKIIKTRQSKELNDRREYKKDSVREREEHKKAVYLQKKKTGEN